MSSVPPPPPEPSEPDVPGAPPAPPGPPPPPDAAPEPVAEDVPAQAPAAPAAPAQPGYDSSTFHAPAWDGQEHPPPSVPLATYGAPSTTAIPYVPAPGQSGAQPAGYGQDAGYPHGPGQPGGTPAWGAPPPAKKGSRTVLFSVLGVVALALVAVGAYFAFFAGSNLEPLEANVDESVEAYAQQIVVGNCLEELPGDGDVDTVTVVPCDEDHQAQVISAKKFSKDGDFPGTKEVKAATVKKCTVGAIDAEGVDVTLVELSVWTPTEDSWDQGDRQGLCIATVPDGLDASLLG